MKTSRVIRYVLAAIFATLACAGLGARIIGSQILMAVPMLLLMDKKELTRPIPRRDWVTILKQYLALIVVVCIFLALMAEICFLLSRAIPEPHAGKLGIGYWVAVVAAWILWMWMIHSRWQGEKRMANI
jgi:hypothetical protein